VTELVDARAEIIEALGPVTRWVWASPAEREADDWLSVADVLPTLIVWRWDVSTTWLPSGELRIVAQRKDAAGQMVVQGRGSGPTMLDALVDLQEGLIRALRASERVSGARGP